MPRGAEVFWLCLGVAAVAVFLALNALSSAPSPSPSAEAAESRIMGQKLASEAFGGWTATVDCPPSHGGDAGPTPCVLTRVVSEKFTRSNARFEAWFVGHHRLTVAMCRMDDVVGRTPQDCDAGLGDDQEVRYYHNASDASGGGIDLLRITQVRFVLPGTGEELALVTVKRPQ